MSGSVKFAALILSQHALDELDADETRIGPDDLALAQDAAVFVHLQKKTRRQSHDWTRHGKARAAV